MESFYRKNGYGHKKEHGRNVISVLIDQFQGEERSFDDVIQKKEYNAKRQKRLPLGN
jgi:hypothetical protein